MEKRQLPGVERIRCLVCQLGGSRLAIPSSDVSEMLELQSITTLSVAQPWLAGITLMRERLTFVIALDGEVAFRPKVVRLVDPDGAGASVAVMVDSSASFRMIEVTTRATSAATEASKRASALPFTSLVMEGDEHLQLLRVPALLAALQ
jgi:chemotaxis signal transduction protein